MVAAVLGVWILPGSWKNTNVQVGLSNCVEFMTVLMAGY